MSALPKNPGALAARLDAPADALDLAGLAARWFCGQVVFRLKGLAALAGDPGLPGRIRGAFGGRLLQAASSEAIGGAPCPWQPPCGFEALWRKQGRMAQGFDHASPWVIGLDPEDGDLLVHLTLFGFANDYAAAACEAMTAALWRDVDWAGTTQLFVPRIDIAGREMRTLAGVAPPPPASGAVLEMLSPLALTGADPREKPGSLLAGLARRLEGLARWHDATLAPALDPRALGQRALALDWRFDGADLVHWQRGSRRQDRAIPMQGLVARIGIGGLEPGDHDMRLALALGETCHIGADIAFGCGRYGLQWG